MHLSISTRLRRAIGWAAALTVLALPAMAGAQGTANDELRKLVNEQAELIRRLTQRIEALEKSHAGPATQADEPPIPAIELPGAATSPAPTVRASQLPDISVIGNHIGRFLSVAGDPDRNRVHLGELEIGIQQPILPGVRMDAFLSSAAESDFALRLEEGYVTTSRLAGLQVGGSLGKRRLDFGKANPTHPHTRPYVDQPAAMQAFLGPDGLNGNGASVNYTLPARKLFANLEIGTFTPEQSDAGSEVGGRLYRAGPGVAGDMTLARLWTSPVLGKSRELEMGASYAYGKAEFADRASLAGMDVTYRTYPRPFQRLLLQGEAFSHTRTDHAGSTGSHTRSGQYLLASWQPGQSYEYGMRYDNTALPWPLAGGERSLSLMATNRLNEVSALRLQYKLGSRTSDLFLPSDRRFHEIYLQFLWGAGSHTHPLQ